MKRMIRWVMLAAALALALILGIAALAEGADTPAAEPGLPAQDEATAESSALEDALDAYYDAKDSSRADALEEELKGYVDAGKLTQEQADLILSYYKEQQALRDGVCPNCGYEFQTDGGFGRGGRMDKGGHGRGGRGGFGGMYGVPQGYAPAGEATDTQDAGLGVRAAQGYNPFRANFL